MNERAAPSGYRHVSRPPFTLADVLDYPARLDVEHPQALSRGLVLVNWWLLALPHYLVIAVFAGGAWAGWNGLNDDWEWISGSGLIGLLVLIAGVALLFTGCRPTAILDFVLGMNRLMYRVVAYAALMSDAYPPFRLDMGDRESGPDTGAADAITPEPAPALRERGSCGNSSGRTRTCNPPVNSSPS